MEKHTLGGLKKILVAASRFYDIQDYFLTLTETNMASIDGKGGKNKVLKEIITATLAQMCLQQDMIEPGSKILLVNMQMVEVRQRYFWHGSGFVNNKHIFSYFYFADMDMGMVSVSKGGMNYFARISVKGVFAGPPKGEGEFSEN
jgi:hypothetical protein